MGLEAWTRSGDGAAVSAAAVPPAAPAAHGRAPIAPQAGVSAPDLADRLPRRQTTRPTPMWWLGVHGGAGESSLAGLAPSTTAADHCWPVPHQAGARSPVVLVARSSLSGLEAAQRAARDWASGAVGDGVDLRGLAIVPDARGRVPRQLRDLAQIVSGGVPRTWWLPWVDSWRVAPPRPGTPIPRGYAAMFSDLSLPTTHPLN